MDAMDLAREIHEVLSKHSSLRPTWPFDNLTGDAIKMYNDAAADLLNKYDVRLKAGVYDQQGGKVALQGNRFAVGDQVRIKDGRTWRTSGRIYALGNEAASVEFADGSLEFYYYDRLELASQERHESYEAKFKVGDHVLCASILLKGEPAHGTVEDIDEYGNVLVGFDNFGGGKLKVPPCNLRRDLEHGVRKEVEAYKCGIRVTPIELALAVEKMDVDAVQVSTPPRSHRWLNVLEDSTPVEPAKTDVTPDPSLPRGGFF